MTRLRRGTLMPRGMVACLLTAALALAATAPATAATASVTTIGALQAALADCATAPDTISLAGDISAPSAQLTVSCDTALDLGTYDLAVRNILIDAGVELTVTGPSDGTEGTLTADAHGVAFIAGIRTTGATLRVTGGGLHAIGGIHGAAIGGDGSAHTSGGTLLVDGGAVVADGTAVYAAAVGGGYGVGNAGGNGGVITVTGGTLTATSTSNFNTVVGGGSGAAAGGAGANLTVTGGVVRATTTGLRSPAIGGGHNTTNAATSVGGASGTVAIGVGGTIIASSPWSAIGGGYGSLSGVTGPFGTVVVDGVLSLPSGILAVPDSGPGAEVQIGATGSLIGAAGTPTAGAAISGAGQFANAGVIALSPPASMVSGNNRLLTFSTGAPSVRVFAPSVASGYRTLPPVPAGTAWNTAADGSGAWFTSASSTAGSGTTALFAVPGSFRMSADPADFVVTAGQPLVFPGTVLDTDDAPLAPQPTIGYASGDCAFATPTVFELARHCTVTASATLHGVTIQTVFDIEVLAADTATLTVVPSASTVPQGGTLSFQVTGKDAYGNASDTSGATLESSVPTDVVTGLTVTFPHASPHLITALLGGLSASVQVEVVPPPAPKSAALSGTGVGQAGLIALLAGGLGLLVAGGVALVLARRRRN